MKFWLTVLFVALTVAFGIGATALFVGATVAAINEGSMSVVTALSIWGFASGSVAAFAGLGIAATRG